MKDLREMTLEELWQLFPVVLTPHQKQWSAWAAEEIGQLNEALAAYSPIVNHIGSTAIAGIKAKPIIDILVEIDESYDRGKICRELEEAGYLCMCRSDARMSFNKGYTPEGYAERVFHVHVHAPGDNDEIVFRDYLTAHADAAREYEALKESLLPAFRHDRDGYTAAKTSFVKRILQLAKN